MVKMSELVPSSDCSAAIMSSKLLNFCRLWSICRYKFAFLSAMPACVLRIVSISASKSVNSELSFLLITCSTPTMSSFWSLIGPQRMVAVLYPVSRSLLGSNRGSVYASLMLQMTPDSATEPAMPLPRGTRMLRAPSATMRTRSVPYGSLVKIVARSAIRTFRVWEIIAAVASIGSSCVVRCVSPCVNKGKRYDTCVPYVCTRVPHVCVPHVCVPHFVCVPHVCVPHVCVPHELLLSPLTFVAIVLHASISVSNNANLFVNPSTSFASLLTELFP